MLLAPLNEEELHHLTDMLDACVDHGGMPIEIVAGFLAGIICAPELIPPSEWLEQVWGEGGVPAASEAEFQLAMSLLMRFYNSIATGLNGDMPFQPLLAEEEDGRLTCVAWADGFIHALSLREDAWSRRLEVDEALREACGVVLALSSPEEVGLSDAEFVRFDTEMTGQLGDIACMIRAAASAPAKSSPASRLKQRANVRRAGKSRR